MNFFSKLLPISLLVLIPNLAQAAETSSESANHNPALTFLFIDIILIAAKLSNLVERFGQPAVLGELVIGLILGNLALAGVHIFEPIKQDQFVGFLAELGVTLLLFQIGLESHISDRWGLLRVFSRI